MLQREDDRFGKGVGGTYSMSMFGVDGRSESLFASTSGKTIGVSTTGPSELFITGGCAGVVVKLVEGGDGV